MDRPVLAITGATGFIGQAVMRAALADGWQLRVLVRRLPRKALIAGEVISVVQGDLDDQVALAKFVRGATAIIHLAGLTKALTTQDFFAANTTGTEKLLAIAAKENPQAVFVQVSSLAAREPQLSPYAASKKAGEDKVRELAGSRPWVIFRPPAVYGPGDTAILPLFKGAKSGFVPYPAAPGSRASVIHVADLARAIVSSLRPLLDGRMTSGVTVEIDDGQAGGYDWATMLATLMKVVGRPVRAFRLPYWLVYPIAVAYGGYCRLRRQADIFSPKKVPELYHPDWVAKAGGLPETCHWQPEFDLLSGFRDTYQWYVDHSFIN